MILITGGLGYIGSHTCVELLKLNYELLIVDNLVNSDKKVLEKIELISRKKVKFILLDITNYEKLDNVFKENNIDTIIHFAGLKSVSESISKPDLYYRNNVIGTKNLILLMNKYNVKNFIFSSSATVYGNQTSPINEKMKLKKRTNPYGETKVQSELLLKNAYKENNKLNISILRYFNPVGAHKTGLIGENPKGKPNNLMPMIIMKANNDIDELFVFGDDYKTSDGSCVRDFIHVVDLARGHCSALRYIKNGINIYNLGTGKGTSVFEIIKAFEKYNEIKIQYQISKRRVGDLAEVYADVDKAKKELNWDTKYNIKDMVIDSWNFSKKSK